MRCHQLALGIFATYTVASGWAAAVETSVPSLKISGTAALSTETRAVAGGWEVRIGLTDEVGRPLPNARVHAHSSSTDAAGTLTPCSDQDADGASRLTLASDASGRACVRVMGTAAATLELAFTDPGGYFARAERVVRLPESAAEGFEIAFDPPLGTLSLDQPLQHVGLLARGRPDAVTPDAAELVLSLLADGRERELTRVALDGLGEVHRLSLVSVSFVSPGPARLIARLRDRSGEERAQASVAILRTLSVKLELANGSDAQVAPGGTLELRASSALGPVPSGVIDARSRGFSVAAARVENGHATLTLPSAILQPLGQTMTVEYVGDGPGWLSGATLELPIRPAGRSYGRYALWFAAAGFAALAVVLGWRRPPRPTPAPPSAAARARASVEVLESFGLGGGYRGHVCDAHEGTPISPAVLRFIGPEPGAPVLLEVKTAVDGSFSAEGAVFPPGTRLEVTSAFHATLIAVLPGPGILQLSLLSRRRALLDRLVHWAERRGKPWWGTGDPTPGHVIGIADRESERRVGQWARAVEHLAYGPNPPDAASEQAAGVVDDPKLGRE